MRVARFARVDGIVRRGIRAERNDNGRPRRTAPGCRTPHARTYTRGLPAISLVTFYNQCGLSVMSVVTGTFIVSKTKAASSVLALLFPLLLAAQNPSGQNPSGEKEAGLAGEVGPTETARPFSVAKKFDYRVVESFGLRGFGGPVLGAAISQAMDTPPEWGQGFGGYATRYASSFGGNLTRQTMAFGLETALHQDPRYFPSKEKGFKARIKNVLLQTLVARKDSGGEQFAYARVASAFASAQLVNVWQPPSNSSFGDGLVRGCLTLGSDAGYNFLQEFIPFFRPRELRK